MIIKRPRQLLIFATIFVVLTFIGITRRDQDNAYYLYDHQSLLVHRGLMRRNPTDSYNRTGTGRIHNINVNGTFHQTTTPSESVEDNPHNNTSTSSPSDDNYNTTASGSTTTTTTRILYTVTTLSEYNSGSRNTVAGSDRFNSTLIPIVSESVNSMVAAGYHVDVYIICGYILKPQRHEQLKQALPPSVGLEIWDDAIPLQYNMKDIKKGLGLGQDQSQSQAKLENHTRGLSRQHRFVLKDKLDHYDLFASWEDDMLIKSPHVQNYLQMTEHLYQLRQQAPEEINNDAQQRSHWYFGNNSITKRQLQRTIPGFMRVEAVLNEALTPIPPLSVKIPVDLTRPATTTTNDTANITIDAAPCCHVSDAIANEQLPAAPSSHDLVMWETQILPLGVRQMPALQQQHDPPPHTSMHNYTLDWVVLQRGTPPPGALADYWSGNDGYYRNDTVDWRPATMERKYVNNQGGYMATQRQLVEWHTQLCRPGFLPPFIDFQEDGLDLRDVEYWSGGMQLIMANHQNGCNLQRVIDLEPTAFAKHILYHTSNNKQAQLQHVNSRFTRLDDMYGMLNTVRKNAERSMSYYQTNYTEREHRHCQRQYKKGGGKVFSSLDTVTPCLVATT